MNLNTWYFYLFSLVNTYLAATNWKALTIDLNDPSKLTNLVWFIASLMYETVGTSFSPFKACP